MIFYSVFEKWHVPTTIILYGTNLCDLIIMAICQISSHDIIVLMLKRTTVAHTLIYLG